MGRCNVEGVQFASEKSEIQKKEFYFLQTLQSISVSSHD